MANGVTTFNLPSANLIDTLIGNRAGTTVTIAVDQLAAIIASGMGPTYSTLAELSADLSWPARSIGYVYGDSVTARRGIYRKSGAADTGSWERIGDLPASALDDALVHNILDTKADLTNAGKMIGTRAAAVSMGQDHLPASLGRIITREGNYLVWRDNGVNADDPLFDTAPYWGVVLRMPNDTLLATKAALSGAGRMFASRAAAVSFGQEGLPAVLGRIMTREGTAAEPRMVVRTPGDGTGRDPLFTTAPYWSIDMNIDPIAYTRDSLIGFSSRPAAVAAGQASYPSNAKVMVNLEGADLVMRGWLHTDDDPLFETSPYWGVIKRWSASESGNGSGTDMAAVKSYAAPRIASRSSNLPITTDARSLWRWRTQVAKLKSGVAGVKPKLILAGDSWNELNPIPQAFRNRIAQDYDMSGWGWWPAVAGARFANAGAGYTRSGTWTSIDVTATGTLEYGSGIDGNLLTTTASDATATLTNIQLTELRIYSRNYGGAWGYTVDGGARVEVTDTLTDGSLKITTISGLADANHTIVIDTVGNTGRVALAGYYLTRDVAGMEVIRAGNGGSTGSHLSLIAPNIQSIAADIQPDVVLTILGTNDYRYDGGVEGYINGLTVMRDGYRAAVPDCGFIFVSPALSNGVVVTPQSQFRDALYEFCISEGHEFYNMTDDWPTYALSNARGDWNDLLHPGDALALATVNRIYHPLLGL